MSKSPIDAYIEFYEKKRMLEEPLIDKKTIYYIYKESEVPPHYLIITDNTKIEDRWKLAPSKIIFGGEKKARLGRLIDSLLYQANIRCTDIFSELENKSTKGGPKKLDLELLIRKEYELKLPEGYPEGLSLKIDLSAKVGIFYIDTRAGKFCSPKTEQGKDRLLIIKKELASLEDASDFEKKSEKFLKKEGFDFLASSNLFMDLFISEKIGVLITHFNCYVGPKGIFISAVENQKIATLLMKTITISIDNIGLWKELAEFEVKRGKHYTMKDLGF